MEQSKALAEIAEIEAYVRAEWLANDGGLTMAASDILSLAGAIRRNIESGEPVSRYTHRDRFNTDSGAESDLIEIHVAMFGISDN